MGKKVITTVVIVAAVVGLLLWAPWITSESAKKKVTDTADYQDRLKRGWVKADAELGAGWRPFGKWVSDGEDNDWTVNFLGQVKY